jgi:hypothetical protein
MSDGELRQMGKVEVQVNGNTVFKWDGDADAVDNVLKQLPEGAGSVGQTAKDFAESCAFHLGNVDITEMQMMGVIWLILTRDTGISRPPSQNRRLCSLHRLCRRY